MHKDLKDLLAKLESQGWRIERGAHTKAFAPDKAKGLVTISCTPSDWRAWKNMISQLRRAGADV